MSDAIIIDDYVRCRDLICCIKQVPVHTAAHRRALGSSRVQAAHEIRKPINQQKLARHVIAVGQSASIVASSRDQVANLDSGVELDDARDRMGRADLCTLTTTGRTGTYAN